MTKIRPFVICFIGTDGSGKSTLIKKSTRRYKEMFNVDIKKFYFGWVPFLPTTKLISKILEKRNYKITDQMNDKVKDKENQNNKKDEGKDKDNKGKKSSNKPSNKFSLFQELMFSYYFIEYLSKYLVKVYSRKILRKKEFILIDRYFYDIYAHYEYARKSKWFSFLLKLFPKPDITFFLNVDVNIARERKPEMELSLLKEHWSSYQQLSEKLKMVSIDTKENIESCLDKIAEQTKNLISNNRKNSSSND